MALIDQLQIRSGNQANMPTLLIGEMALADDEKRLYIGSSSGNIFIPCSSDMNSLSASINGAINIAYTAYNNNADISLLATASKEVADTANDTSTTVLDNYNVSKYMQIYIATETDTSIVPIPVEVYSIIDLGTVVLDVYYRKVDGNNILLDLGTDYTIDTALNNINLLSIVLDINDTIKYRIYK